MLHTKSYVLDTTHFAVVVQSLSRVQLFVTPTDCSMSAFPVFHGLSEFAQTHVH